MKSQKLISTLIFFIILYLIGVFIKSRYGPVQIIIAPDDPGIKTSTQTFKWMDFRNRPYNAEIAIPTNQINQEWENYGYYNQRFRPDKGFIIQRRGYKRYLMLDFKGIYQRNIPYFRDISEKLMAALEGKPITAFSAFVQGMPYKIPPTNAPDGKYIHGFWPPIVCLSKGKGDCDTKSLLYLTMLGALRDFNQKKLIVKLRSIKHVISGIEGTPRPGQMYLTDRRNHQYYILVESSSDGRPQWRPGFLGQESIRCINSNQFELVSLDD
jgi:hypothetical protein